MPKHVPSVSGTFFALPIDLPGLSSNLAITTTSISLTTCAGRVDYDARDK